MLRRINVVLVGFFLILIPLQAKIIKQWRLRHRNFRGFFNYHVTMDKKRCVVTYKIGRKYYLFVNNNTYGPFDILDTSDPSRFEERFSCIMGKGLVKGGARSWGKRQYAYVDGKVFGPFAKIEFVRFSPDNKQYAFCFNKGGRIVKQWSYHTTKGGKWYVNVNGKVYGPYDGVGRYLRYVGRGFAFTYKIAGQSYHWINGKRYGPYNNVGRAELSGDGTRYACFTKEGRYSYLHLDGKRSGPYLRPVGLRISHNGKMVGFSYTDPYDWKSYVYINGKIFGPDDRSLPPKFSHNGKHWGFHILRYPKKYLNINGKMHGPFKSVTGPVYFDKGRWLVYTFDRKKGHYLYVNGKVFGPYSRIFHPKFYPDFSKYFVYYWQGGYPWVIVDGKRQGPFKELDGWVFSANGKKVAFLYQRPRRQGRFLSVLGKEFGPYSFISDVTFTADGKQLNFRYQTWRGWYIYNNGKRIGPHRLNRGAVFSPNLKRFGFTKVLRRKHYVILDGKRYGPYDIASLRFQRDNKAEIVYLKRGVLYVKQID